MIESKIDARYFLADDSEIQCLGIEWLQNQNKLFTEMERNYVAGIINPKA